MYIKVSAVPGAKKEKVSILKNGGLKIEVREQALQNLANTRIIELVARHHKVPTRSVRMISGHRSRSKVFSVDIT
jgi:uncharacterized protein